MGTVAAPVRPETGGSGRLGWLQMKGASKALKLRHNFRVDDHLRMELGLDLDVKTNESTPWASLLYTLDASDPGKGGIEVTPEWVVYTRSLHVGAESGLYSVPLHLKAGLAYDGTPHVEVGTSNVALTLSIAALLLAMDKPISIQRKEVGGLSVALPIKFKDGRTVDHTLRPLAELDGQLSRQGRSLALSFSQLNAVLRLRQD